MWKIQVIIKDDDSNESKDDDYKYIMNKRLTVAEGELLDELEYYISEVINYMAYKYKGLIKASE